MKNILLTGGTGNLGEVVVKSLSDHGYNLHLSVRKDVPDATANVFYYKADLSDRVHADEFVQQVMKESHRIDAAVFLAGGFEVGNLDKTSMDDIIKMINLNFATAFNTAQKLIAHFRKVGGGKLIFVGAKAAMDFKTAGNSLAYSLSKQLLHNFSAIINESEKASGITSHIILPGIINTVTNRSAMPDADTSGWVSPDSIALVIAEIIEGKEPETVIAF